MFEVHQIFVPRDLGVCYRGVWIDSALLASNLASEGGLWMRNSRPRHRVSPRQRRQERLLLGDRLLDLSLRRERLSPSLLARRLTTGLISLAVRP
jgi:hypothetical protein